MAHHKKKHPRIASKGFCTLCKPHKRVGCKGQWKNRRLLRELQEVALAEKGI